MKKQYKLKVYSISAIDLLKVYVLGRLDVEPRHILVIDDDELVSEYLGALLEAEDYEVMVLNEPVAALEYFKAHPNEFDLIVTDQIMPGLTGIEIAQSILELRPDIPVLLITGYSEKISAENAKSFGLSGFFPKPINENLFLDKIYTLVECMATH